MKKLYKLFLAMFLILFFISCATTSKSTQSGVLVGEDTGEIGVINNWKNPDFKGGKTTKIVAEGFASSDNRGEANVIDRALEIKKKMKFKTYLNSLNY